jgi:hypothetical protein
MSSDKTISFLCLHRTYSRLIVGSGTARETKEHKPKAVKTHWVMRR